MAAPSNPTLSELVAEGLAKAGVSNPSSSLTSRAENKWMEEIKNDVYQRIKSLKILQVTSYGILTKGQSRYSFPSDFASDLEITLLYGGETGTAQAGSASSITLASDEDISDGFIVGKDILITSGTGAASLSQVTAYNTSTKVATVVPDFKDAPGSGSGYMVIDNEYPIESRVLNDYDRYKFVGLKRPEVYFPIGDEDYGEFIFNSAPDLTYGARLRYYANIMKVDVSSTHMSTLYLQWRNLWIQGIKYKKLSEEDDDRAAVELAEYRRQLNGLVYSEMYGRDVRNLTDRIADGWY